MTITFISFRASITPQRIDNNETGIFVKLLETQLNKNYSDIGQLKHLHKMTQWRTGLLPIAMDKDLSSYFMKKKKMWASICLALLLNK